MLKIKAALKILNSIDCTKKKRLEAAIETINTVFEILKDSKSLGIYGRIMIEIPLKEEKEFILLEYMEDKKEE